MLGQYIIYGHYNIDLFKINKHVKFIMKVLVLQWSLNRRDLELV
jgi:hypothetical protein